MPRPRKTDTEVQAIREQILDTALIILQEKGVEGITSREIAVRLGVAHMSLFTYFTNQAAILGALRNREMLKWRTKQSIFEQRAQSEEISGVVLELLESYITFALENPNLFRLALVTPEAIGESPHDNRERIRGYIEYIARLLKMGMERGVFEQRDPFLAAAVVLGMVNMPHTLFHNGKLADPFLRDNMVTEMLSASMQYLRGNK